MTYVLYGSPGTASFCVHWMLIELGIPFKYCRVDFALSEQYAPRYLKMNPAGRVPTLVVDGIPYSESAALLFLLAERHPSSKLAPSVSAPDRALFLQWMFYLANTVMPAFRQFYYPQEGAGEGQEGGTKTQAVARIDCSFALTDALLADGRTYLIGDRLSAADFLLGMLGRWSRNLPKTALDWPHLGTYICRMRNLASYRETHKREDLSGWID